MFERIEKVDNRGIGGCLRLIAWTTSSQVPSKLMTTGFVKDEGL